MNQRVVVFALLAAVIAASPVWAQQAPPAPPAQQTPPAAPAAPTSPVAKQPKPKSQAEVQSLQAIFQAPDLDSRVKAGNEFLNKFADSEFKPVVLMIITSLYQQKNDYDNMIIWGERALEADPQSYSVMLMLGQAIASRTKEFDLDREEKLGKAEKYANTAVQIMHDAPRPRPDVTDEQWAAAKKDFSAQAHEVLGLAAMARKKYDVAVTEFKTSSEMSSTPDATVLVRLGNAYNELGKYDDAIAVLDKVMAAPDTNPVVKQFAQAQRARAVQAKQSGAKPGAAAAPAAGTPVPAQVEIKKP